MNNDIDKLESILRKTAVIIDAVKPEQGKLPTPCPDYDVEVLVDHLNGWLGNFAAQATGVALESDPNTHKSSTYPGAEFRETSARLIAALRDKTAAEPPAIGMMLIEYITHGWDLASAIGQPVTFTDDEAKPALEFGRLAFKPEFRGPGKVFGYEVQPPAGASEVDQLIAFMGRDPHWTRQAD